jgi:hypothetical protein
MVGFPGSFAALFLPLFFLPPVFRLDFFAALFLRVVFLRLGADFFATALFLAPAAFRRVVFRAADFRAAISTPHPERTSGPFPNGARGGLVRPGASFERGGEFWYGDGAHLP